MTMFRIQRAGVDIVALGAGILELMTQKTVKAVTPS
jgi:hypothetical protein